MWFWFWKLIINYAAEVMLKQLKRKRDSALTFYKIFRGCISSSWKP